MTLFASMGRFLARLFAVRQQPAPHVLVFGFHRGKPYIVPAKRVHPLTVYGKTGTGKSTFAINQAYLWTEYHDRKSAVLVDIKDNFVQDYIRVAPAWRLDDLLLFDAADKAFPPALNFLAGVPEDERSLAVSELIAAFKQFFGQGTWGVRLEHVLRNAFWTLLCTPESTLIDVPRLLTEPEYRDYALSFVTNDAVLKFWYNEFPGIVGKNNSSSNIESILNKWSILTTYPPVRNILGQTRRGLDISSAMNNGTVVLINLAQGVLGNDASSLIAALIVAKLILAMQARVNQEFRREVLVCLDEVQTYCTDALTKGVTEGRSMGLRLMVCSQYAELLPADIRTAFAKNVSYQLTCQLDTDERSQRERHMIELIPMNQVDPETGKPPVLTLAALPPLPNKREQQLEYVKQRSRNLLATPREQVERDIERRMREVPKRAQENANGNSNRQTNHIPSFD